MRFEIEHLENDNPVNIVLWNDHIYFVCRDITILYRFEPPPPLEFLIKL